MSDSCKPPFLIITKPAPAGGEMNAYYVYMKEHPDPTKKGVYVVDIENPLNKNNIKDFPVLTTNKEYVLTGNAMVNMGGRRRSKKAPTARRRRSSKSRKARATRRK